MELIQLSMKDQIYNIVKERILNQKYQGGEVLKITELCKEFGISNTPIREALSVLEKEGFLVTSFNYKYQVFQLTEETAAMINQALAVLLCGAYRCVVENGKTDLLIQKLTDALAHQKTVSTEHISEYINGSIAFDRCIVEATENAYLCKMYDAQTGFMVLSVRHVYQTRPYGIKDNLKEHEEILNAVKAGETEQVTALIKKHYEKVIKEKDLENQKNQREGEEF